MLFFSFPSFYSLPPVQFNRGTKIFVQIGVMDKERETGDGTLDRFSHYPYAPSVTVPAAGPPLPSSVTTTAAAVGSRSGNLPPVIGSSVVGSSDPHLGHSQPFQGTDQAGGLLKRNQINLSAYAFPPGFIDQSNHDDLNQVIKQTILNNGKTVVDMPAAGGGAAD